MAGLFEQVKAQMMDHKTIDNFNNEVGRNRKITEEDKRNYVLAHEEFQEYKKKDPNWMRNFNL